MKNNPQFFNFSPALAGAGKIKKYLTSLRVFGIITSVIKRWGRRFLKFYSALTSRVNTYKRRYPKESPTSVFNS